MKRSLAIAVALAATTFFTSESQAQFGRGFGGSGFSVSFGSGGFGGFPGINPGFHPGFGGYGFGGRGVNLGYSSFNRGFNNVYARPYRAGYIPVVPVYRGGHGGYRGGYGRGCGGW